MSAPNNVLNEPIRSGTVGPAGPVGPRGFQGAAGSATSSTWADVLANGNSSGPTDKPVVETELLFLSSGLVSISGFPGGTNVGTGIAIGDSNDSSASSGTPIMIGVLNTAGSDSIAIGRENTMPTGYCGVGKTNTSSGFGFGYSFGDGTTMTLGSGAFGIAVGASNNATIGNLIDATGIAIGRACNVNAGPSTSNNAIVAIGNNNTVTASGAGAIGANITVNKDYEWHIGDAAHAAAGVIFGYGAFRTLQTECANVRVTVDTLVASSGTASQQTTDLSQEFDILSNMVSLPAIELPQNGATYLVGCQGAWGAVGAPGIGIVSLGFSGSIVGTPICVASTALSVGDITYVSAQTLVRTNGTTATIELFRAQTSGIPLNFLTGSNFWATRIA